MADGLFGGRVAVKEELGRGAMGVVHRAELDGETVAIKILHAHLTADVAVVGRFVREHQALRRIQHPNVVKVMDLVIGDPLMGMVMEYLEATDLSEVIAEDPPDPATAVAMVADITGGVAAIHKARVVHRDLKPANIMITSDGETKITDFGISRLLTANQAGRTTATIGTPLYMSPEAAGSGDPIWSASDIYSLGVILFEMLVGEPPFNSGEPLAVAVAHVNNRPPTVGGVPDELTALVDSMLAKSPDDRPTAVEVEESLRGLADSLSGDLQPVAVPAEQRPTMPVAVVPPLDAENKPTSEPSGEHEEIVVDDVADDVAESALEDTTEDDDDGDGDEVDSIDEPSDVDGAGETGEPDVVDLTEANSSDELENVRAGAAPATTTATGLFDPEGAPASDTVVVDAGPGGGVATPIAAAFAGLRSSGNSVAESAATSTETAWSRAPETVLGSPPAGPNGHSVSSATNRGSTNLYGDSESLDSNGESDGDLNVTFDWGAGPAITRQPTTGPIERTNGLSGAAAMGSPPFNGSTLGSAGARMSSPPDNNAGRVVLVALGAVILIAALGFASFRPGGWFRSSDSDGAAVAYSFTPVLSSDGLIVTRLWRLDAATSTIDATVIITNPGEGEVVVDHYEVLPAGVDDNGFAESLTPEPDEVFTADGSFGSSDALLTVARFFDRSLTAGETFRIGYTMVAPDGISGVAGLEDLASQQQQAELDFLATLPSGDQPIEVVVEALFLDPSGLNLDVGDEVAIELGGSLVDGEAAMDMALQLASWSVDDPSVATVLGSGVRRSVRAVAEGETTLTVQLGDAEATARIVIGAELLGPNSPRATVPSTSRTSASSTSQTTAEPVPDLQMSALGITVNNDQSFRVTFQTNLCTIARYEGAGQTYVTSTWPDVVDQCWERHGQSFLPVEPGSYVVTVAARSADGQLASRSATVVVEEPKPEPTSPPPTRPQPTEPPPTEPEPTDPTPTEPPPTEPEPTDPTPTEPPPTEPEPTDPTVTVDPTVTIGPTITPTVETTGLADP